MAEVEKIDWENLDMSGTSMCSIEKGVNCESCAG